MAISAMSYSKSFAEPDESRPFPHGRSDTVSLGGTTVARLTFEPGWHWADDLKPKVGTASCQVRHSICIVSGRLATRMDSGEEFEIGPGEAAFIGPGHDGWVVGDEPVVAYDFTGGEDYAKAS